MHITLEKYEFKNIIMEMSEIGAANYAKTVTPIIDLLSERQAFMLFERKNVRRWLKEGSIDFQRVGPNKNSIKMYSYSQLLTVSKAEELIKFIYGKRIKK